MKRILQSLLFAGVLAVGAALAAPSASAANKPHSPTTVRVIWQPSGEFDYYYATDHHIWKEFGLKIVPTEIVTGPEELSAMASNSADIAYMGAPPGITGVAKGIDMVAVSSGPDEADLDGLYASPKSGIKSIRNLAGKTVGVPKGTTAQVDMYLDLKQAGVPLKSLHIQYMNPPQILVAMERGNIDAAWVWDSWGQRLVQAGARLVVTSSVLGVADAAFWWVQRDFLNKHPHAVARFVAALAYSASLADRTPGAVVNEYARISGINAPQARLIWKRQPALTIADLTSPTEPLSFLNKKTGVVETAKRVAGALVALGVLSKEPANLDSHFDSRPVREALVVLKSHPSR